MKYVGWWGAGDRVLYIAPPRSDYARLVRSRMGSCVDQTMGTWVDSGCPPWPLCDPMEGFAANLNYPKGVGVRSTFKRTDVGLWKMVANRDRSHKLLQVSKR
jgi:hypothetical protein